MEFFQKINSLTEPNILKKNKNNSMVTISKILVENIFIVQVRENLSQEFSTNIINLFYWLRIYENE